MYDRKIQETRTRKEEKKLKKVREFYFILVIIVLIFIFFTNNNSISRLILGVRGVIIKGISENEFMKAYNFNKGYEANFTVFNFTDYLIKNKPDFIRSINSRYIFFDKFKLTFVPRKKVAILHKNNKYYFMDSNGFLWGKPTMGNILDNLVVFNVGDTVNISALESLKKYVGIISEIDYKNKVIYLKKGKILKFENWDNLKNNVDIFGNIYDIMKNKRVLYLVGNKILIK
jgi:cell division septal protein FtsQ